ncbi:ABC transporter substrate-binding protein [Pseudactinotalea sp.]|uniref:ABC transporter substrate-binding protein n=1 Tax=Pseudactinotalea sp. TaxID=1926260 RepID=UPI003B3A44FF
MKHTRITFAAAAVAAAALTLTACGGGGGGSADPGTAGTLDPEEQVTITMTWWGNDDRADRYNQAIELFNEEYPNITVQASFSAWDDYWTARATEAAGNSLPDVMQTDLAYLSQFGNRSQFLDLTPYIDNGIDGSGMSESLLDSGKVGDALVGIPQSTNTLALFYNPATLATLGVDAPEAEQTWDEFVQWNVAAAEAGAGLDPQLWGTGDFTGVFWLFVQHLVQEGVDVFTDDGQVAFGEQDIVDWLNVTAPLRDADQFMSPEATAQLDPLGGFTANLVGTEFSWDNFLAGYLTDSGAESIEMLPLPVGSNGEHGQFFKPSMLLSASANSEHPEAAAALIDFITNDPEVGTIFGTSRGVPASESARSQLSTEGADAQVIGFEEEWADVITESTPVLPEGYGSIEAEWLRLASELAYKNITVEDFASQWLSFAGQTLS